MSVKDGDGRILGEVLEFREHEGRECDFWLVWPSIIPGVLEFVEGATLAVELGERVVTGKVIYRQRPDEVETAHIQVVAGETNRARSHIWIRKD